MSRYEKCPTEVGLIVDRMLAMFHQPLSAAGVTIETLFAFPLTDENGDSVGPALKHGGYQANAVVRVIGLKDRTAGRADVEIVIDGEQWPTWSDSEKDALIDHELEHLELRTDKDGLVVRDDLERAKLRIRKHDCQFGWFDAIARRHGKASFEVQQFEKMQEATRQKWLPFMDANAETQSGFVGEVGQAFKDAGILAEPETSVTLEAHGKSVTLSASKFEQVAKNIRKGRGSRKAAAGR